jgi:hypothetical protein
MRPRHHRRGERQEIDNAFAAAIKLQCGHGITAVGNRLQDLKEKFDKLGRVW